LDEIRRLPTERAALRVIRANEEELELHNEKLAQINKASDGKCVWLTAPDDAVLD